MQRLNEIEIKNAKKKYDWARSGANKRGIEMRLSFSQWIKIWLDSGHWHERGTRHGNYVMARFKDQGHYELGNIEIKLHKENVQEYMISTRHKDSLPSRWAKRSQNTVWKNKSIQSAKKAGKANKKKIQTPYGVFDSRKEAACALNIHTTTLRRRLINEPNSYFYF